MPARTPQLAKLARPRLPGVLIRERLFAQLDGTSGPTVVWVEGPPGAGKTTLVSSWLEARKRPAVWIQIDAGDTDPAAFFFYLREAARALAPRARVPLYSRAFQSDLAGFARRFFRQLFSELPPTAALILDNVHEIGCSGPVIELLPVAAEEVSPGMSMVAMSRMQPPAVWARLLAHGALTTIDAEQLRLTPQETAEIASASGRLSLDQVARAHRESGGWVAGVRLIVEALRRGVAAEDGRGEAARETLFAYFATQVFDRATPATQRVLMATALFPRFDAAMASATSGESGAADILEQLYRARMFTDRRGAPPYTYEMHALFREFLLARLRAQTDQGQLRGLQSRAAALLEAAGYRAEAFSLYGSAANWDQAARIVLIEAESLLDQGRWRTLLDWVNALPVRHSDELPWLQYWRGMALMSTDLGTARLILARAGAAFARRGDYVGASLSAAGVLEGYFFEYDDLTPVDESLDTILAALERRPRFTSASAELAVYSAALIGLVFRRPGDDSLQAVIERVGQLLHEELTVNRRLAAAQFLLNACYSTGDFERGNMLAREVERLAADENVSEMIRYQAYDPLVFYWFISGEYEKAKIALDRAVSLGSHLPQPTLQVDLWMMACFLAIQRRDFAAAQRALEEIKASSSARRGSDRQFYLVARAWFDATRGDLDAAIQAGVQAAGLADAKGVALWRLIVRLPLVLALLLARRHDDAARVLNEADALLEVSPFGYPDTAFRMLRAVWLLRTGVADPRQAVTDLFSLVATRDHGPILNRFALLMPELCAAALAMNAEVSLVKGLIGRFGWPPPALNADRWPWRVRILTLGVFEIEREGEAVKFRGKAPRRVLEVLKVLIAYGGRDVHRQQLVDALWPDEEGDAGHAALEVAIARLRKLLGRPEMILVRNEQLSINADLVWVDCLALEEVVVSDAEAGERTALLLGLYKGDFLPSDGDASWSVRTRLRLRASFVRTVSALAASLETEEQWQRALELYDRGLRIDDLAEEFYQGIMRCCLYLDRIAEGMSAYRRMRQNLSIVLGIAPSSVSQALARRLATARPGNAPQ